MGWGPRREQQWSLTERLGLGVVGTEVQTHNVEFVSAEKK